jgi:hypothetical protein
MNWIDAQFIKTAVAAVMQARAILAVSYVMGFFLPEGTHVELFENYQGFMEEAAEKLSQVAQTRERERGKRKMFSFFFVLFRFWRTRRMMRWWDGGSRSLISPKISR